MLSQDSFNDPLVSTLNRLLMSIGLPFDLETPLDLTPSLLLAILESLLENRLPIPQAVRESRDHPSKVHAMKVFLGVLESDVIKQDVGLSDIDPRRLASGDWEETVFVGELLCWLGRQTGILPPIQGSSEPPPERATSRSSGSQPARMFSPSTHSSLTTSALSVAGIEEDSNTTITSFTSDVPTRHNDTRHTSLPLCIHELEDPSFLGPVDHDADSAGDVSHSFCHCAEETGASIDRSVLPVRYDGYIEEVDAELELRAFEKTRTRQPHTRVRRPPGDVVATPRPAGKHVLTRHTSPTQHTLALLNERAKLLSELARLDLTR
ncbi:hypothetical protein OF83DRAFT_1064808 [Amylostereum chailletii]|nr:hypothetical protein OF83DRAFT_1064808 [Amylostereum chailletii]